MHSRTLRVFFLEMLWGSVFWYNSKTFIHLQISQFQAYFHLTLNHTEKNTEIAMSDKSTGSVPAFCLRAASPGYFKGNCKDLHKRQLLFSNVAIRYLGFFFSYNPLVTLWLLQWNKRFLCLLLLNTLCEFFMHLNSTRAHHLRSPSGTVLWGSIIIVWTKLYNWNGT